MNIFFKLLLIICIYAIHLAAQTVPSGIMWRNSNGSITVLHPRNGFVASPSAQTLTINWDKTYFNIIPGPQDSALISLQPPTPGPGLQTINGILEVNTAVLLSHQGSVSNSDHFCLSTSGNPAYSCSTNNLAAWNANGPGYRNGEYIILIPDITAFGPATVNVNFQGSVSIKLADGTTDPGPLLKKDQAYLLIFYKAVWRMSPGDSKP